MGGKNAIIVTVFLFVDNAFPDAEVRLEGVLMHGTDDMSTKDVLGYFKVYGPRNVEWINDKSCAYASLCVCIVCVCVVCVCVCVCLCVEIL